VRVPVAVATVFLANGAGLASWLPHIPTVQAALGLGPAALGVALLGMAAGALLGIPLAGLLIPRVGSRAVLAASALVFFGSLCLPLLAPDVPRLLLALVVLGASNGAMDVSMNAQAVAAERRLARPILSALHGTWSVGGLGGAAAAGLALGAGVTPLAHVGGASAVLGIAAGIALSRALPPSADPAGDGPRLARPSGLLLGLGAMALLALLAEGAIGDWSAVYFRQSLGTSPALAAGGFAAFSLAMAVGRFAGDRLVARVGGVRLVRASATLAAVGLGAALLLARPAAAMLGCAAVGLGLANLVPILFRAAGRVPGVAAGHGLAAVSTAGYCGFLAGPPVIGLAAEAISLPVALALVVAALGAIALQAGALAATERPPSGQSSTSRIA
jgi:predicted MFS family arabinose efflux permease